MDLEAKTPGAQVHEAIHQGLDLRMQRALPALRRATAAGATGVSSPRHGVGFQVISSALWPCLEALQIHS